MAGKKIALMSSISEIQSQMWYTRCHAKLIKCEAKQLADKNATSESYKGGKIPVFGTEKCHLYLVIGW